MIQINTDDKQWVSDSPYLHAFDRLDEVHHQLDEKSLSTKMIEIGFKGILQTRTPLPNGKALLRMDFINCSVPCLDSVEIHINDLIHEVL